MESVMVHRTLSALIPLALVLGPPVFANASEVLAKKYACTACHQAAVKVVGPAWKDIAAKYADGSVTAAQLAAAVRKGSSGKWGAMAMPAQSQVPDQDAQSLAAWVLQGAK
jgi:cytochrome c